MDGPIPAVQVVPQQDNQDFQVVITLHYRPPDPNLFNLIPGNRSLNGLSLSAGLAGFCTVALGLESADLGMVGMECGLMLLSGVIYLCKPELIGYARFDIEAAVEHVSVHHPVAPRDHQD